jgi:hypothetical protein
LICVNSTVRALIDIVRASASGKNKDECLMRRFTMTLTAVMLVLGTMCMAASAQTQAPGAVGFHAQLRNATPIIKEAACNGQWGIYGCPPGTVRYCRGTRCWCGRC